MIGSLQIKNFDLNNTLCKYLISIKNVTLIVISMFSHYSYVCFTSCMHILCIHIQQNDVTLVPLTWTRVCSSHHFEHTLNGTMSADILNVRGRMQSFHSCQFLLTYSTIFDFELKTSVKNIFNLNNPSDRALVFTLHCFEMFCVKLTMVCCSCALVSMILPPICGTS